jgi:phosphohistidine phosphatase
MKELIFLRHAKSDWGNAQLKDIDRYLSERGYNDAYFLSTLFNKKCRHPEQILCSTATRALSTALIFARAMDFDMTRFNLEPRIYEASVDTLLYIIAEQEDAIQSLMLVGHNPGFTSVCNALADEHVFDNVPTCGMVSLQFDCQSWREATNKKAMIRYHLFPKDFKTQD